MKVNYILIILKKLIKIIFLFKIKIVFNLALIENNELSFNLSNGETFTTCEEYFYYLSNDL